MNPQTTVIIDYTDARFGGPNYPGPRGNGEGDGDVVEHDAGHYELIGGVWADIGPGTDVDPKLAFVIDLSGFPAGSGDAILAGFAAWEVETGGDLFDEAGSTFENTVVAFGDGINTYSMRNLGGRVLAATFITWNDANGDGEINDGENFLEMDVVFNFTVSWATDVTSADAKGKWFDVESVAAHEDGHVFGMAHSGNAHDEDAEQTMFATVRPKETKKQDLEANGDIPGIQSVDLGYLAPSP